MDEVTLYLISVIIDIDRRGSASCRRGWIIIVGLDHCDNASCTENRIILNSFARYNHHHELKSRLLWAFILNSAWCMHMAGAWWGKRKTRKQKTRPARAACSASSFASRFRAPAPIWPMAHAGMQPIILNRARVTSRVNLAFGRRRSAIALNVNAM